MKKTKSRAKTKTPRAREPKPRERKARDTFPIVGIGASAGGLEALQQFFERVSERPGAAFVIVHHRDPTHQGMLAEILQRSSKLPVAEARDGEDVLPDRVYIIPANKDLAVEDGKFRLLAPNAPRGLRLPIDFFFRSLATERGERAVGVILSGMGSDGTLGLRAIKEHAGAAFVQTPESAKFDAMPRSAIDEGLADVVAPPEELPKKILAHAARAIHAAPIERVAAQTSSSSLDRIFVLLRALTGNDFSQYKRSTIFRRIERRMGIHQIDSVDRYVRYLRDNTKEAELLSKELLIGVTSFFRDPTAWEHLENDVLPALVRARRGGTLRAWVTGCSTGEEAYSLAIVLREVIQSLQGSPNVGVQIFATDLDRDAIEKARAAVYPPNIAADVTPERLHRFFVQEERGYRVSKDIREMVVFAPQNLIMDPPFTKLDFLSCRNLLIYLSPELQKKLVPLFYYALNPGGALFLGNSETVGAFAHLFAPGDAKSRVYRRLETPEAPAVDFPVTFDGASVLSGNKTQPAPRRPPVNLQAVIERIVLERYAPAAVLANDAGDILYISGSTGAYLEPPAGKANWNLLAMARDGLRYELTSGFSVAAHQKTPIIVRGVVVRTNGNSRAVDLTIEKLSEPEALRGKVLVIFAEAPAPKPLRGEPPRAQKAVLALEEELRRARDEAQTLHEQMQTSDEDIKSANEELQSTNEELQSTNEELTTSKEELQSLNEELQTVNQQLQSKVDELAWSNNDLSNLLNSTDFATLFLDTDLRVRRFTRQTSKLIKLIPTDIGRPITDIASELEYRDLADDAREVLRTLAWHEKLVATRDGRWFAVRILPYRTLENVIDGIVVTFTDATASKQLEASLLEQTSQLRQLAESLPNLVFGCEGNGTCDYLNAQWVGYTGVPAARQLGHRWLEQVDEHDRERMRREWGDSIKNGKMLDTEARIRSAAGAPRWFKIRAVPLQVEGGGVARWYGSCTDVDDLKRAADRARR